MRCGRCRNGSGNGSGMAEDQCVRALRRMRAGERWIQERVGERRYGFLAVTGEMGAVSG